MHCKTTSWDVQYLSHRRIDLSRCIGCACQYSYKLGHIAVPKFLAHEPTARADWRGRTGPGVEPGACSGAHPSGCLGAQGHNGPEESDGLGRQAVAVLSWILIACPSLATSTCRIPPFGWLGSWFSRWCAPRRQTEEFCAVCS